MVPQIQQGDAAKTVAVIDIGSNSIRLVIAQVFADGHTEVLERARQPIHLGHDTFTSGKLSQQTMRAGLTVLRDYRRLIDTYKVDVVRAVATSAVREAANRDSFLDRIARTVDLDVDVIEAAEQSRLMVAAVRHVAAEALGSRRNTSLIAEVGGGSTLLTMMQGTEIAASQSLTLGSIRMQEMLSTGGETPTHSAEMVKQIISNGLVTVRKSLRMKRVPTFIAIGGDARFAVTQVGEPMEKGGLHVVDAKKLAALIEKCIPYGPDDLSSMYGLAFADAETLVPALLVYQALMRAARADKMIVSQVSMRDGLLLDLPRYFTGQEDPELTESVVLSAKNIGMKYLYDAKHAEHVTQLSLRLFDELQKEHGLGARARLLLHVASLLHEVGKFVSNRSHHKHSWYLLSNTEILGLRRDDIAIVATVARYHRRSTPKTTHTEYIALPREQRMVVNKLAAILRVADALDRGHWQQISRFQLERQDQDLVLYVKDASDLTLERRALTDKEDLFEDIYGMKVRLEAEGSPAAAEAKAAMPMQ